MSDPHLKMAEITLPGTLPHEAGAIAQLATKMVIEDVAKGRVTHLILLTFQGSKARLWQLHDVQSPDDIVRAIIQREEPQAIAFVHPMPLPPEVEGDRGYNVAVEAPSGKVDSLIALRGGEGLGGQMVRIYSRRVEDVGPRWLGVPPEHDVELWVEGFVGGPGDVGEA